MKFGISYNLVVPRPLDNEQWGPDDEHKLMKEVLEQVEFADKLGYDYVWGTEHHLETAMLGARFGMGALGVGFETPEEAEERVNRYWTLAQTTKTPIGLAMNPAISTSANLMMGKTNEEALKRGMRGAQYFGFSLAFTNGEVHHGKDHLNRTFTENSAARVTRSRSSRSKNPRTRRSAHCYVQADGACSSAHPSSCARTLGATRREPTPAERSCGRPFAATSLV